MSKQQQQQQQHQLPDDTIDSKSSITQTVTTVGTQNNTATTKRTTTPNKEEGTINTSHSNTLQTTFHHRPQRKKTKESKIPASSLKTALRERIRDCPAIERGIQVMKVTSYGHLRPRTITVTKDRFALLITHFPVARGKGVEKSSDASRLPIPFITRKGGLRLFGGSSSGEGTVLRYLDIADIDSIHVGYVGTRKMENARESNRLKGHDSLVDRQCHQILSILHHGDQTIDFLVLNDAHRQELVLCLDTMVRTYKEMRPSIDNDALLLRYLWYDVDQNRDGRICEREFPKILCLINLYVKNPRRAYRKFRKEMLGRTSGALTSCEMASLLYHLKDNTAESSSAAKTTTTTTATTTTTSNNKSMPNQIWDQIFGPDQETVGVTKFMTSFCHACQGELQVSLQDVKNIFSSLNDAELNHVDGEPPADVGEITRSRFEFYLLHEMNSAYDPKALTKRETKNDPMSRYWINTSHNTYLTGDQLTSASSVEMYLRSLQRGCKCLELDCWDGEKTEQGPLPVVYHGHTVTSKILFLDIIRVVKAYVDENALTYPIILSLENHCSPPFQRTLAFILEDLLGDRLYVPLPEDRRTVLPAPEALRGKVVIKGKRPPEEEVDDENGNGETEGASNTRSKKASNDVASIETKISSSATTVPELARLTLFHGTKYKNFETSITEPVSHMHSISETKITKVLKASEANASLWRLYNLNHMTRTYPAGTRVDSSNYNPVLAWSLGCQLVALNFQGNDSPLFLNDGKFRQHDNCGYLRRPDGSLGNVLPPTSENTSRPGGKDTKEMKALGHRGTQKQEDDEMSNPDMLDNVMDGFEEVACGEDATKVLLQKQKDALLLKNAPATTFDKQNDEESYEQTRRLRIRVLSGSCLPKPKGSKTGEIIDPYCTITVHDVVRGTDGVVKSASKSLSTDIVNNNGFCPVWNQPDDTQFVVSSPQVAIVEFDLQDQDLGFDDKVATAAIPVRCLRKGYRSVQLHDANNTRTGPFGFANLLVEVQIFTGSE